HNPELFLHMFPWLYLYGLGRFGNARMTVKLNKSPHVCAQLIWIGDSHSLSLITTRYGPVRRVGIFSLARKNFDRIVEKILSPSQAALDSLVECGAGHLNGSHTARKYQHNEIKSLIYENPLCLYYCSKDIDLFNFSPVLPNSNDHMRAITRNSVGAARFFDHIVKLLDRPGLFGPTEAYYGTTSTE
ncbi:hypothetical protein C8T65DRAFT_703349, partial [Cerioporus squamosus]